MPKSRFSARSIFNHTYETRYCESTKTHNITDFFRKKMKKRSPHAKEQVQRAFDLQPHVRNTILRIHQDTQHHRFLQKKNEKAITPCQRAGSARVRSSTKRTKHDIANPPRHTTSPISTEKK